jgi:hypothetical protein
LVTKGGLKSDRHNLSIGLKSSPVGPTIQIATASASSVLRLMSVITVPALPNVG